MTAYAEAKRPKLHSKLDKQTRWCTVVVTMISWRLSLVFAVLFCSKPARSNFNDEECDDSCFSKAVISSIVGIAILCLITCLCYCCSSRRHRGGRYQRFSGRNRNALVTNPTLRSAQITAGITSREFMTHPEGYDPVPQESPDTFYKRTTSNGAHVYVNPVSTLVQPYTDHLEC